jgi:hypothetical protein
MSRRTIFTVWARGLEAVQSIQCDLLPKNGPKKSATAELGMVQLAQNRPRIGLL